MAVPKRRTSRARRDKRRTHQGLKPMQLVRCTTCSASIKPHHVCPACGHYRGRQVIVGTSQ
ncbi:MAG: 50S ribosomal protein L32 [Planctomycetes bacterium]|nr:50S ribosomal protein L32 [Planctomycetota bacterium]MCB9871405.1 50S ribosomal protein L32 [Planctomycetota bacterium]MCB9888656.1 50S ribosomal protein L32 [Planctomycetota bacterium]